MQTKLQLIIEYKIRKRIFLLSIPIIYVLSVLIG